MSCGSRDMRAKLVKEEGQERGLRLEASEAAGQQAVAGSEGRIGSIGPGQGLPQRGETTVAECTSQLAAPLTAAPPHSTRTHPPPRPPASATGSRWRCWARRVPPPRPPSPSPSLGVKDGVNRAM